MTFTASAHESSLTPEQLRDLIRELTTELGRITRRLELTADANPDDSEAQEQRQALIAQKRLFVDALERVAAGHYGVCLDCSAAIPYGRLLLHPEGAHCATCTVPT